MPERSELPFPESKVFEAARATLASLDWKLGELQLEPSVRLRIGRCFAFRQAADRRLIAYSVTVMIDPRLGVP